MFSAGGDSHLSADLDSVRKGAEVHGACGPGGAPPSASARDKHEPAVELVLLVPAAQGDPAFGGDLQIASWRAG